MFIQQFPLDNSPFIKERVTHMDTTQTLPMFRRSVDALDKYIKRNDDLDLILSMIPTQFGSSEKATYLGFRAVGLTAPQALKCLGLELTDYLRWMEETPQLADFENEHLPELQARCPQEIIRLGFMRNMAKFILLDGRIIDMAHNDVANMSENEFAYLKTARRHYTAKQFLDLERAVHPEKHQQQTLVLNFSNSLGEEASWQLTEGQDKVVFEPDGQIVEPSAD